jgi:hypothetical protein
LRDVDDREPVQHLGRVTALAGDAFGLGDHADLLVEANVRRPQPRPFGQLADRQQLLGLFSHRGP